MLSGPNRRRHSKAFFSLDASFAIFIAVLLFTSFAMLANSSAMLAKSYAKEISGTNAALRLSSYVLNEAAAQRGGPASDPYVKPGEIDTDRLGSIDLDAITARSGIPFASISVTGAAMEEASVSAGSRQPENFCVQRLALLDGGPALLKVCIA